MSPGDLGQITWTTLRGSPQKLRTGPPPWKAAVGVAMVFWQVARLEHLFKVPPGWRGTVEAASAKVMRPIYWMATRLLSVESVGDRLQRLARPPLAGAANVPNLPQ